MADEKRRVVKKPSKAGASTVEVEENGDATTTEETSTEDGDAGGSENGGSPDGDVAASVGADEAAQGGPAASDAGEAGEGSEAAGNGAAVAATMVTEAASAEMVTAVVPKTFQLRKADHTVLLITAGIQELEEWVVEHWWSKANGVTRYLKGE